MQHIYFSQLSSVRLHWHRRKYFMNKQEKNSIQDHLLFGFLIIDFEVSNFCQKRQTPKKKGFVLRPDQKPKTLRACDPSGFWCLVLPIVLTLVRFSWCTKSSCKGGGWGWDDYLWFSGWFKFELILILDIFLSSIFISLYPMITRFL